MWIGMNYKGASRGWEWADGSGVSYTNWDNGEPNNWEVELSETRLRDLSRNLIDLWGQKISQLFNFIFQLFSKTWFCHFYIHKLQNNRIDNYVSICVFWDINYIPLWKNHIFLIHVSIYSSSTILETFTSLYTNTTNIIRVILYTVGLQNNSNYVSMLHAVDQLEARKVMCVDQLNAVKNIWVKIPI